MKLETKEKCVGIFQFQPLWFFTLPWDQNRGLGNFGVNLLTLNNVCHNVGDFQSVDVGLQVVSNICLDVKAFT